MEKKKVLVVDDEPAFRRLIVDLLKKDFDVDTAESGRQGFQKAMTGVYDLITMDIKMPGLDGVEAIRSIKIVNPNQRILVITAYADDAVTEDALGSGAEEVISKPFDIKVLLEKIHSGWEEVKE